MRKALDYFVGYRQADSRKVSSYKVFWHD